MNLFRFNTIERFIERKYYKKIFLDVGEIIFWIFLLSISLVFIYIHGPIRVSDGYYGYAQILKSQIFEGSYQTAISPNDLPGGIKYRIIYPLLVALSSGIFGIGLFEAGVIISVIAGLGCILYFSKLFSLILRNNSSVRLYRMALGSFGGFLIYWSKFTTDILFFFFIMATLFSIIEIWENCLTIGKLLRYSCWTVFAILTRELGIFLIVPMIYVLMKNKNKMFQIKITFLLLFGFIFIGITYFIIRLETYANAYGWINHLYYRVFSLNVPNGKIHLENLPPAISQFFNFYFSPLTIFTIAFAVIYTAGIVIFLLFLLKILEIKSERHRRILEPPKHKGLFLLFTFLIPYLIVLFLLQARYMNERYLLPLIPFTLITMGVYIKQRSNLLENAKYYSEKNCLIILITMNLLIVLFRLLLIIFIENFVSIA